MRTMKTLALISRVLALFLLLLTLVDCETETPTTAVVVDGYPAAPDGGNPTTEISVFKAWYVTTLFVDGVAPGATSGEQRIVPANDYAYAILAPGWDPSSMSPPTTRIPVRSFGRITASRGEALRITVSDAAFEGNCLGGKPLSQEDADFITQRIFPGDFASVAYDAKTCTSTPIPMDGGAGADAPTAATGN